jgi:hypothetical protein
VGSDLKMNMSFELEEPTLFPREFVPRVLKIKLMLEMESDSVRYLVPYGSNVSHKNNILLNDLSVCVKLFPFSFKG